MNLQSYSRILNVGSGIVAADTTTPTLMCRAANDEIGVAVNSNMTCPLATTTAGCQQSCNSRQQALNACTANDGSLQVHLAGHRRCALKCCVSRGRRLPRDP